MRRSGGDELSPRRRRGFIASLSLEHKLPMLFGGVLLVVVAVVSAAAYVEMRRATLDTASQRLNAVTFQLRDLFRQSGAQLRVAATTVGANAALAEYVQLPSAERRARALSALAAGTQSDQFIAAELRDAEDRVLLASSERAGTDTVSTRDIGLVADSARVGRLRLMNGMTIYPVAAPVRGTAARVVQWRKIAGSARGREELARLIGSDAMLLIGNADSSHWSDLVRATSGPGSTARVEAIPGSPWLVAVDFNRDSILAPVHRFLWRLAFITLAAIAIALAATWVATRRITTPLRDLTRAARHIASGDYTPPRPIDRADEVGLLSDAFATMAAEVRDARVGLEAKVEERTSDLNRTLEELHEAQAALVRREKLATLGQLAGGVGHELRNPLGVMTNAVYYLRMVLPAEPVTVHEYLDILQQQITLSEKIVTDLLDFARSRRPTRAPMSIVEVTGTQIARLGPTNGVRVDADLRTIVPSVFADQVQVGQIILNLLTNAVQAVDGKGVVTVRVGADGDHVHVDVSDSGPGIASSHVEKIFEPLFTTKARGIGLGLAVSRTLARANEGDLMLVSMPGQGATFRLVLPMSSGASA